jgi:hypothetical protein
MRLATILIALFACLMVSGQAANQAFTSPTNINGNVNVYFTGTKEASIYQGVAGFTFETAHDGATIYFQGCYDTDDWRNIDTVTASGATLVDQIVYQSPPLYKNYRLWADGAVVDTCIITNARYFLKY